jgi:hypothetical protein
MPSAGSLRVSVRFVDPHHIGDQLRRLSAGMEQAAGQAMDVEALRLTKAVRTGIIRQAPAGQKFKPLAASTIAMKKSSKALIDKGDLLASIAMTRVTLARSVVGRFVGVHRTALGKDGRKLANIAEIHEFGTKPYTIPVTPKLRAWWAAMAAKGIFAGRLSKGTKTIRHPGVPARPFMRPPWEAWSKGAEDRLKTALLAALRRTVNRAMLRRRP